MIKNVNNFHVDLIKMFYDQKIDFNDLEETLSKRKYSSKNFTTYSLDPFEGDFNYNKKRHLLNRILVGYSKRHMDDFEGLNLTQCIELIFSEESLNYPSNIYYHDLNSSSFQDKYGVQDVEPNDEFINKIHSHDESLSFERMISTWSVFYQGMYNQSTSIHWKLFLFLHNLTPSDSTNSSGSKGVYAYGKLLFDSCFRSYKDFIYNLTLDNSMIVYLNLYLSQKDTPDENFAREIQELFTQGNQNENNFTEDDVREIARALVGWGVDEELQRNSLSYNSTPFFNHLNHDTGDKQFSSYYNNRIIRGRSGPEGAEELDEVIDMLFETENSSKYIVRRLYQFFVYPVISDEIENQIIEPLSQVYRDNNFSLIEPLKILLSSEHFYSPELPNSIIKSPLDFLIGLVKEVDLENCDMFFNNGQEFIFKSLSPEVFNEKSNDLSHIKYYISQYLMDNGFNLGMRINYPPSVAGWPSFYRSPVYDLFWMNTTTTPLRQQYSRDIFYGNIPINTNIENVPVFMRVNYLEYLLTFNNPYSIDSFLEELILRFINIEIPLTTKTRLKSVLLGGNNEVHWSTDVTNFLSDNRQSQDYYSFGNRISEALSQLTTLSEFQLH